MPGDTGGGGAQPSPQDIMRIIGMIPGLGAGPITGADAGTGGGANGGGGIDWASILGAGLRIPQITSPSSGGSGGGGSPGIMDQIMRALGLGGQGNGGMGGLLPLIAALASGGLGASAATRGANQMIAGLNNANTAATNAMGNITDLYKPYIGAGAQGLATAQGMPQLDLASRFNSNLASRYSPISSGRGISLAALAGKG
jgi:hypothetical protein